MAFAADDKMLNNFPFAKRSSGVENPGSDKKKYGASFCYFIYLANYIKTFSLSGTYFCLLTF